MNARQYPGLNGRPEPRVQNDPDRGESALQKLDRNWTDLWSPLS